MGISFDRDGYRASIFKNALAGYLRTESPASLIDLKSIFPRRREEIVETLAQRTVAIEPAGFPTSVVIELI